MSLEDDVRASLDAAPDTPGRDHTWEMFRARMGRRRRQRVAALTFTTVIVVGATAALTLDRNVTDFAHEDPSLVIDHAGGFAFTLPEGWVLYREEPGLREAGPRTGPFRVTVSSQVPRRYLDEVNAFMPDRFQALVEAGVEHDPFESRRFQARIGGRDSTSFDWSYGHAVDAAATGYLVESGCITCVRRLTVVDWGDDSVLHILWGSPDPAAWDTYERAARRMVRSLERLPLTRELHRGVLGPNILYTDAPPAMSLIEFLDARTAGEPDAVDWYDQVETSDPPPNVYSIEGADIDRYIVESISSEDMSSVTYDVALYSLDRAIAVERLQVQREAAANPDGSIQVVERWLPVTIGDRTYPPGPPRPRTTNRWGISEPCGRYGETMCPGGPGPARS